MINKKIKVSQIADFLDVEFDGKDYEIDKLTSLNEILDESMSFSKSVNIICDKKALLLVPLDFKYNNRILYTIIKVKNPRLSFAKVVTALFMLDKTYTIDKTATIGKNTTLLENISIGKYSLIGDNVKIGKNTVIYHHVVVADNTVIGDNCIIKSGAKIGEEGFGFDFEEDGTPVRIPHIGNVDIGNNVEIKDAVI